MASIQRATLEDIPGIAHVVEAAWPDNTLLVDVTQEQITRTDSALWVIRAAGHVAGFAFGFLTKSYDDVRHWEIDLLAVHPRVQGHGLSGKLIGLMWKEAEDHGVDLARALVRIDNTPAQKAFTAAGFENARRVQNMYLWSPMDGTAPSSQLPFGVMLRPVDTLTYRGLWIEGMDPATLPPNAQREIVTAARTQAAAEERFNTSALIPAHNENRLAPDMRSMGVMQGSYHWWTRTN